MGTIYEIICWTTGRRYVGKTIQNLKRRLRDHESDFRNRPERCCSRLILERGNYEMYELEKVEDESKLNEREYYYIQHTDCVNHYVGKWLDEDFKKEYMKEYSKEYYEANKEVIKEYMKEYREANREDLLERHKEYREANKEAISERGKEYRKANKEAISERGKEYRKANKEAISERGKENYTCECGSILRKKNKKRHERGCKQHLDWLATQV